MNEFARVSVNVPSIMGCFDYHIPEYLRDHVQIGCLVEVSFGSQNVQGVIIHLHNNPEVEETKDILGLIDPLPVLNSHQIEFGRLIADRYFCTLSQAVELMIPPV